MSVINKFFQYTFDSHHQTFEWSDRRLIRFLDAVLLMLIDRFVRVIHKISGLELIELYRRDL